jgi:hypothetical protein
MIIGPAAALRAKDRITGTATPKSIIILYLSLLSSVMSIRLLEKIINLPGKGTLQKIFRIIFQKKLYKASPIW